MEFYKEGDKSKAICEHCKKIVATTFKVRNALIKDGHDKSFKVPQILVGVCDLCDLTVSIPQQSSAAIGEVIKKEIKETIDVRLPRHFLDILNNAIVSLGIHSTSDKRGHLLRFYIASAIVQKSKALRKKLDSSLLKGNFKRSHRLTLKFNSQLDTHFHQLVKTSGLKQTEIIDALIVMVSEDILDKKNKLKSSTVRTMLLANG
jgi:predicted XRE-type DNA-binding protein